MSNGTSCKQPVKNVFLNDGLVEEDRAAVSVADGGLLYGAGLFETMRTSHGVVFCLDDHLDRLAASARHLSIELPFDKAYLVRAIESVLEANGLTEARLRLTVTTGPVSVQDDQRRPTVLVAATPFHPYPAAYYEKGIAAILCPYRQNPDDPLTGHKTTCYFPRMLALRLAHGHGAAEALWFTPDGSLAEGCISNVFLVKEGKLLTPPLDTPVLAGVARKTVCRLAKDRSIELIEQRLAIDDLLAAEEVFLTNVIMTVLPVIGIEKHTVGEGKVGPVSQQLRIGFEQCIENQCRKGK